MIIELEDRKIACTPEEYREMLLKGLIGDGPIWTGNLVNKAPAQDPARKPRHGALLSFQGHSFEMPVVKAMELKALMESFIPGAVILVEPNEAGTEEA